MISKRKPFKHMVVAIIFGCATISSNASDLKKEEITAISRKVADWQIQAFPNNKYAVSEPKGWIAGAFYMGMSDWAQLSGDEQYFNWLKKVFNRQHWQVADRMYHADDVITGITKSTLSINQHKIHDNQLDSLDSPIHP